MRRLALRFASVMTLAAFAVAIGLFVRFDRNRHEDLLYWISAGSKPLALRWILWRGQDPNAIENGRTLLQRLIWIKPDVSAPVGNLRILLEAGADPNARGSDGPLPLLGFVENGGTAQATLLLRFGADPNVVDEDGFGLMDRWQPPLGDMAPRHAFVNEALDRGLDPCRPVRRRTTLDPSRTETMSLSAYLGAIALPDLAARAREACAARGGGGAAGPPSH